MPYFFLSNPLRLLRRVISTEDSEYLDAVKDLVQNKEFEQLSFFLESEKRGMLRKSVRLLQSGKHIKIHRARVQKDYAQYFESFSQAFRERKNMQELLLDEPRCFGFLTHERRQLLVERLEIDAMARARRLRGISRVTAEDRLFGRALAGKRVLVVGPSPGSIISQEMLDGFDVIAIPKLYGDLWIGSEVTLRPRHTVVTYFNHSTTSRLRNNQSTSPPVWHFCRVKSPEDASVIRELYVKSLDQPLQVGVMASPEDLLHNQYGPFMGTAMLYDLLLRRPANLFVTGFSFFVGNASSYRATYDSSEHNNQVLIRSLRLHGAFSNFMFVRNLLKFGHIAVDSEMADILRMSPQEYAAALDSRFSADL